MLTPVFDLTQDHEFVFVRIKVPHVKVSDLEFYIDGDVFKFYVKPYFLRLHLPHPLVENGKEKAQYDVDKSEILVHLPKLVPGEHFPDLDMLTTLLAPRKSHRSARAASSAPDQPAKLDVPEERRDKVRLVEEMPPSIHDPASLTSPSNAAVAAGLGDDDGNEDGDDDGDEDGDDGGDEFAWDQALPDPGREERSLLADVAASGELVSSRYGFNLSHQSVFGRLRAEFLEAVDISDPDHTPAAVRHRERVQRERDAFSEDHYMADFIGEESGGALAQLLLYKPWWLGSVPSAQPPGRPDEHPGIAFTDEEKEALRSLKAKSLLLENTREEKARLYAGLVDILCAYAYNARTTEGESNVESCWTVWKLSPSLCGLDSAPTVDDAAIAFIRRGLCFPLHRHWLLLVSIVSLDVGSILALGRRAVLRCLLEVRSMFLHDEERYFLCELFLDEYCLWIQQAASDKTLRTIADRLQGCSQLLGVPSGGSAAETLAQVSRKVTAPSPNLVREDFWLNQNAVCEEWDLPTLEQAALDAWADEQDAPDEQNEQGTLAQKMSDLDIAGEQAGSDLESSDEGDEDDEDDGDDDESEAGDDEDVSEDDDDAAPTEDDTVE